MYQFGNVSRPAVVDRIIDATSSWDDLGPRAVVGTCIHRMDGTLTGTDQYFRTTASHGGNMGALTDFGIGGQLDLATDNDGVIFQWNSTAGRRAPWANGKANDLDGHGIAFVEHYGIVAVNRDLVSIELSGCSGQSACGPETPVSSRQLDALAALIAYVHDAAGVPFDVFPRHPKSGLVTCLEHWEFSAKDCPFPAVRTLRDRYLSRAKDIMRDAQKGTQLDSVPATPPTSGVNEARFQVVAKAGLNLRSEPGLTASIVVALPYQTTVTSHGPTEVRDGYAWLPVTVVATGISGYVAREYLGDA